MGIAKEEWVTQQGKIHDKHLREIKAFIGPCPCAFCQPDEEENI